MPIYLPAPAPLPGGPDGEGWNRLSLGAHYGRPGAQCALRPRTYATLWEARTSTTRARFGSHGSCIRAPRGDVRPDCLTCPVLTAAHRSLEAAGARVLVRLESHVVDLGGLFGPAGVYDLPFVVTDPDRGWDSPREQWSWEELVLLPGWELGRQYRDEHSAGFWLERTAHPGQSRSLQHSA
ncbi:hypothetical protein [Nocardia sp. IFM 10818]